MNDTYDKSWTPPPVGALDGLVPNLEVKELLKQHNDVAVYSAFQTSLNRNVALHIMPLGEGGKKIIDRVKALAGLNHPHILKVHDIGVTDSFSFKVMEWIDGRPLDDLLGASEMTPALALNLVSQICDALQYAHDMGIAHCHISPESVIVDEDNRIKITGFDSANKAPVDYQKDIHALGHLFYQMLTGEEPEGELLPPSKKVALDVRLDEVVMRAMATTPGACYSDMTAMKTQIQSVSKAINSPRRKKRTVLKQIALLLVIAGIVCAFFGVETVVLRIKRFVHGGTRTLFTNELRPGELKYLKTDLLIDRALADVSSPWAWRALETKDLTEADARTILHGLRDQFKAKYPTGFKGALHWQGGVLDKLEKYQVVCREDICDLMQTLHGQPTGHVRNEVYANARELPIEIRTANPFCKVISGVGIIGEVKNVRYDGQPAIFKRAPHAGGGSKHWGLLPILLISPLRPGKHIIEFDVDTALVNETQFRALSECALSNDWPKAKRRWTRKGRIEFFVTAVDAFEYVADPKFDPVANDGLGVTRVVIQSQSKDTVTANLVVNKVKNPKLPLSFDITFEIAGNDVKSGRYWVRPETLGVGSNMITSYELPAFDPAIKTVDITFTPQPRHIQTSNHMINRLWGKPIVFRNVPLIRNDIASQKYWLEMNPR